MTVAWIHTLEPLEHGGVIAKVRVVDSLLGRFGHATRLLYTATEQVPTGSLCKKIRYFLGARPRWERQLEFEGFSIPHWPLPSWLSYAIPAALAFSAIRRNEVHLAVSGSNHCALPAALLKKKYLVWIGTLYEEELRGKALAGDAWAKGLLGSFEWKALAKEERFIFEHAALILTNGSHTAAAIHRRYPALADRLRVVIYPVDTDIFKPGIGRRDPARPYLLFTARINDPRKNVRLLLEAFLQIRRQFPEIRLVLTGDSPNAAVQQTLQHFGLEDNVQFVGYQSREALVELYQGAELFTLASSQEGLGISMLEALACGLPVVSTRCGGPESVIRDGYNGRLVANGDAAAFAEAVIGLLSDPDELAAMRARCVAHAQENFSRRQVEQHLLDALRSVYEEHFT